MRRALFLMSVVLACGDDAERAAPDATDATDATDAPDAPDSPDSPDSIDVAPETAGDVPEAPETIDAAPETVDAAPDVVLPLPGFGTITGACGVLDDELTSPEPSLFVNHIDFGEDPYDEADIDRLTDGGREILADGNAGGSSILSEVFAFELLARCEGAQLLKTETEINYDVAAKITDMVLLIDGLKVGANPTRAIGFPFEAPYTVEQARTILEKKLNDILSSTSAVSDEDRWVKQILTVFAYAEGHVAAVEEAWQAIDAALRADTIVIVTVTDGSDRFIYSDE